MGNQIVRFVSLFFSCCATLLAAAQQPIRNIEHANTTISAVAHSHLQFSTAEFDSLLREAPTSKRIQIFPTANLSGGGNSRPVSVSWLGAYAQWRPGSRLKLCAGYALTGGLLPDYLEKSATQDQFIPGFGYAVPDSRAHLYHAHYTFGSVEFRAGKHVVFELGKSKHFWGDGHRSMVLSDNASPVPFFKISTTLGKFRYVNLWMHMRDISSGQPIVQSRYKYAAMHALSYQITPRLNASVYEWVVWQSSDSLSRRGVDLYYLNPLVFYRPVEYSLGSPDNVMLAASIRWDAAPSFQLYGQFVLDEFNLKLYRRSNNWWGNKIAGQLGFKWKTPVDGLELQSEVNLARPFIYTHGSSIQAWTHLNQPMAHPLGSNFMESSTRLIFSKQLWKVCEQFNFARFGRDYDADADEVIDNFGGNITRSYANPYGGDFGHKLLQGELHQTAFHSLTVSRALTEKSRWEVYAQHILRKEVAIGNTTTENWIMVGIQTRGVLQPVQDY